MTPFWTWWTDLGMPCWTGWPALGIAGVLVFAAACFAGLWLVARVCPEIARRPGREAVEAWREAVEAWREAVEAWREAVEAWAGARDALRDARADVKRGATNLAAAKRRLARTLRELKAAGERGSSPLTAGGDAARAAMEEEARDAVADAGRTLGVAEEEAHRRRGAMAERRRAVRERARDACVQWRKGAAKCLREIRRQVGVTGGYLLWKFLRDYFRNFKSIASVVWKNLLSGRNLAAGSLSLLAITLDLAYYRHFNLDALEYYSSASLTALASTVLMLAGTALLTFAVFLCVVAVFVVGAPSTFWMLAVLAVLLAGTALQVLGVLPLIACRSTLCARLAAPGRGTHA